MKHRETKIIVLICMLLSGSSTSVADSDELVLVAARESALSKLDARSVRRAYLGGQVQSNGVLVVPLHNTSNPMLADDFMQHVMFMTSGQYEHQLTLRNFRDGSPLPRSYTSVDELIKVLSAETSSITYMSRSVANGLETVKIISGL